MLQLGSSTFEVDGVTVCRDHADEDQFWYLATRVALDKRPDGSDAISLLKWKPAAVEAGVKGGGFLMFQTVVTLPEATRSKILGRCASLSPSGNPRLAPAPIDAGTVRCIALNLEGGGGTSATPPPPGAFNAVTKILGATKPSLSGNETAAFSLVLDQEGAIILEKAFESGTTPVGVIYELEYSGLTPDVQVIITADFERIYNHFSVGLEAQIYWFKIGIDAAFEQLRQEGVIDIKVINADSSADQADKEKWALDFFKQELLPKWFEPSLDLGQVKGPTQPEGLDAVLDRLKKLKQGLGSTPTPHARTPTPTTPTPTTPTPTTPTPATPTPTPTTPTPTPTTPTPTPTTPTPTPTTPTPTPTTPTPTPTSPTNPGGPGGANPSGTGTGTPRPPGTGSTTILQARAPPILRPPAAQTLEARVRRTLRPRAPAMLPARAHRRAALQARRRRLPRIHQRLPDLPRPVRRSAHPRRPPAPRRSLLRCSPRPARRRRCRLAANWHFYPAPRARLRRSKFAERAVFSPSTANRRRWTVTAGRPSRLHRTARTTLPWTGPLRRPSMRPSSCSSPSTNRTKRASQQRRRTLFSALIF